MAKDKPKRAPNASDICPKHNVFYKSCGCKWQKGAKKKESEDIEA